MAESHMPTEAESNLVVPLKETVQIMYQSVERLARKGQVPRGVFLERDLCEALMKSPYRDDVVRACEVFMKHPQKRSDSLFMLLPESSRVNLSVMMGIRAMTVFRNSLPVEKRIGLESSLMWQTYVLRPRAGCRFLGLAQSAKHDNRLALLFSSSPLISIYDLFARDVAAMNGTDSMFLFDMREAHRFMEISRDLAGKIVCGNEQFAAPSAVMSYGFAYADNSRVVFLYSQGITL